MSTIEITTDSFGEHIQREGIVLVDFWASWCGPCRTFAPIFEEASEKHPEVTWGKVDTDAQPDLSGALGIRAIPTLMAFRDGVLVFEHAGVLPTAAIDRLVEEVQKLDMDEVRRLAESDERSPAQP
jgi:thioredoxin 1